MLEKAFCGAWRLGYEEAVALLTHRVQWSTQVAKQWEHLPSQWARGF